MLKKILLGLGGLVIVAVGTVLFLASRQPDTFSVERSIVINAPADDVFDLIDNFHNWQKWSPYEKIDPNMKRTYGDPVAGVGATYSWAGNGQVGEGRMEIMSAEPTHIVIKLDFVKPFEAHNIADFTIEQMNEGGAAPRTNVTWEMSGPVTFLPKIMHVIFNMDKMVGGQFEEGLAALKLAAEE